MQKEVSAIIVEDNRETHLVVEKLLEAVAPNVKIIGNAFSLAEAEMQILKMNPDIVFLDIQFESEGKTSFELLERLNAAGHGNFRIIIITAHCERHYLEEAFNFGAAHYLTKPIDKEKLKAAVERCQTDQAGFYISTLLNHLREGAENAITKQVSGKLVIDGMNYSEVVQVEKIVYLQASGRYTSIFLADDATRPICSTTNLGELEKRLKCHQQFFRIHRNLLINCDYILRFSKKDRSVILKPPFARQYASRERFREFVLFMGVPAE